MRVSLSSYPVITFDFSWYFTIICIQSQKCSGWLISVRLLHWKLYYYDVRVVLSYQGKGDPEEGRPHIPRLRGCFITSKWSRTCNLWNSRQEGCQLNPASFMEFFTLITSVTPKHASGHVDKYVGSNRANRLLYPTPILPYYLFRRPVQKIFRSEYVGGFEPLS